MKGFIFAILTLTTTSVFANTRHPASSFVNSTLVTARQILEQKSETARLRGMCSLLTNSLEVNFISSRWLGDYASLRRDQQSVQAFPSLIPSILISKAIKAVGGEEMDGSFSVSPTASSRGNNVFAVSVTVTSSKHGSYTGSAIVRKMKNNKFRLLDVEFMGFSGVAYQGREYNQIMDREYQRDPNRSLPVTALIRHLTSDPKYVSCN